MIHVVQDYFSIHIAKSIGEIYRETEMISINRRKVLKGISAAGAATLAPISLKAASNEPKYIALYVDAAVEKPNASPTSAIINKTNKTLVLNAQQPFSYQDNNGQITTVHLNSSEPVYNLKPGGHLPIYAKAELIKQPESLNIHAKLADNALTIV